MTETVTLQTPVTAKDDMPSLDLVLILQQMAATIDALSASASPNAGGVIVGQYYDNSFDGGNNFALAGAADRLDMAPFYTSKRMRIDEIGVLVSTAVAASLLRCFIYGSDDNGWPDDLLFEGAGDLVSSSTGFKFHALDFTFDSGRQYWLGVRQSSTAAFRSVNTSSAINLGLSSSGGTSYFTVLRRTLAFATPLPASWVFVSGDRDANITPPSIRMRAAALP